MGRPVMRHPFKFLCFGIALLGVALSPLRVPGLSGGSQGGGSPGPIPTSPWPPAVRNATIGTLPTMGWNSWNHFACGIDENLIEQIADAMVNGGLQAAGYDVVTLDACWSARNRDAAGNLSNDPQAFPSGMKALGDYIHARGLRFGLYTSIGTRMCGDVGPGSLDHEVQDVATLASWGVDYIKADRCSADGLVMKDLYARWRDAIAVDQDRNAFQAIKVHDNGAGQEVWSKPLASSGSRAVGLLNRGRAAATIGVDWSAIGLATGSATVRDLEAQQDRGTFVDSYSVSVPAHGLALLRILGTDRAATGGYLSDQPWTYMANENGPVERDMSNGGSGAGDGRALSLNGSRYAKGFGTWAPSAIEFRPDGSCSTFTAEVGIDDEAGSRGTVSGPLVGHSCALAGTFNVVLTVTDNGGASNTATAAVSVTSAPRAEFSATPRAVLPGIPIRFDGSNSTVPGGHIVLYAWDFADGATAQGRVVMHAYSSHGIFSVRLLVKDNFDRTNETQVAVAIGNRAPTITSTSPSANSVLQVGELGTFTIAASDPDGDLLSYSWTIDGVHIGATSGSYAFASLVPGAFAIRVIATDGFAAVLFEWRVTVEGSSQAPAPPPTAGVPETVASLGVVALGLLVTLVTHALRTRKRR